ncbi:MAG: FecR/PupR family sigma factor regulator, partial [Caulobacteraceae bacterium]
MLERLNILIAARPRTAEAWLARMARPGAGAREQAGLMAWLEADPDHLRQYEQAKADQAALEPLRSAFAGDLAALRRSERKSMTRRPLLASGLAMAAVAAAVVLVPMFKGAEQGRL